MARLLVRAAALLSAVLLLAAVACGAAATSTPPPTAPPVPTATPAPTQEPTQAPAPTSPQEPPSDIQPILATTVLDVGPQRVAFLLATSKSLVSDAEVTVTPVYVPDGAVGETLATEFHLWPYGVRGAFATEAVFDRAGQWRLDIEVSGADASGHTMIDVEVVEDSPVPAVGSIGPLSENKTLAATGDLTKVTTDYSPDPDLYQLTIKEAVESPLPAVVVFASPAFCTSPTCGPQVDTVSELKDAYRGQANFIHVEIYDNPDEIQGDLDRAQIAVTVDEWGLSALPHWFNESWTFVLDAEGRIQGRFEGFAAYTELEAALSKVLAGA